MSSPTGPGRHVIYTTELGADLPALLVEWRQQPDGWLARIIYVTLVRADHWGVVDEWVPAAQVRPT